MNRFALPAACMLLMVSVCARADDRPPAPLLARTSQQVASFLDVFSDVKCTEQVRQLKLRKNGKVDVEENSTFDYLVIAQAAGGELSLEESRLEDKADVHRKGVSLLMTNGFATLLLIFHPQYASSFEFTASGDEVLDGRRFEVIRFRHIKGRRTPMALMLRGREYPLELTGEAWIDPRTAEVARIHVELQESMEDVGLRALSSDVIYSEVKFRGANSSAWLPTTASIDVETPRQHWRNLHRFTNYQRFSVNTEESVKATP